MTTTYEEHRKRREANPQYRAAARMLRPHFDLAAGILRLRLRKGWTQAELAERSNTRQANISRIESALANPSVRVLQKIADALDADLEINFRPRDDTPSGETLDVFLGHADTARVEHKGRWSYSTSSELPVDVRTPVEC